MGATLNKTMSIGRLCNDVEPRIMANGGKVSRFRLAMNDRRRDKSTGDLREITTYVDVEVWNRGEHGKMADMCEQHLHQGSQVYVEGQLRMDEWLDKATQQKRSKLYISADSVQFLDPRPNDRKPADSPVSTVNKQDEPPY